MIIALLFFVTISDLCFRIRSVRIHADPAQQVESLFGAVIVAVNHPSDTGLNNQFRTFDTRGGGDVERRAVAVVGAFGHLGNGVGFGVQDIGFGLTRFVLADILEAAGVPL